MDRLELATERIRQFRDERDWLQFHNPKNLAISISIEASELLEHFQWSTPEQSFEIASKKKESVAAEIADVAIYLIELADNLKIDLPKAIMEKISENEVKYPVHKARGNSLKYTELRDNKDSAT